MEIVNLNLMLLTTNIHPVAHQALANCRSAATIAFAVAIIPTVVAFAAAIIHTIGTPSSNYG
jgi:hypothetical protein